MTRYCFALLWLFTSSLATATDLAKHSRLFNTQSHHLNQPIGGLSDEQQDQFILGRSFFTIPWVTAPSVTTARDGLGPLFNANTCTSCHRGSGLGEKFNADGKISRAIVTKLSRKSRKPVPHYGEQIAVNGLINVPFEALPTLQETPHNATYPDGKTVTLKRPTYGLKHLNYGDLPDDVVIVQRRAPALIGLGLLSRVSEADILANADENDANQDGISGRPNWVVKDGKKQLGRFTTKASAVSVREQTAIAAANDMGLTNPLFPEEKCMPTQTACLAAPRGRPDPSGNRLDLTAERLAAITTFLVATRVPIQKLNKRGKAGKKHFKNIGCASCHLPQMTTADGVKFAPYTDLLLHDMGKNLADGREEFSANGREYRTAPLWGLSTYAKTLASKTPYYLHDGRAATVEEAILWHGGEAESAKQRFMRLPAEKRAEILSFLNQL